MPPVSSGARGLLGWVVALHLPAPLLGLLVAVLSWNVTFSGPSAGLDSSWGAGLFMAVEQGLDFGDEVVWTYGPLGFLGRPDVPSWFSDLAVLTYIYTALLYVTLCATLIWALRRSIGSIAAAIVTFLAVGLLPGIEAPLVIAVALCFAALIPDRSRHAVRVLIVGGSLLAAVECLIKLSVGPPIILACLVALFGARARPAELALFGGLFVAEVIALWLVIGQSLPDLGAYVLNGREVISGYSEAMGVELLSSRGRLAAIALLVAFVAAASFGSYRDARARAGAVALAALIGFALLKEGIVRYDIGHITIFISTVTVLFLLVPWTRARLPLAAAGAVALFAVVLAARPGDYPVRLDPVDGADLARVQTEILLDGSRREEIIEFNRAFMIELYALEPEILAELEGRTVAVEPWEVAVAWAYDLEWSPLPVMQGYQAYTDELDELNAEELGSAEGPERILRESQVPADGGTGMVPSIDGRYPSWDPPAQALAILCNFEALAHQERWQVLGRIGDRCGEPELIETVDSSFGEAVEVPEAGRGEVVFARIAGAGVEGLEKLRSLLFRAEFRMALLDVGSYRLVPGTAENGLLLRGDPRVTGAGAFSQAPQAEQITLAGSTGELTYEFFRMDVGRTESPGARASGPSASS